jgi:hypothetical protein
LRDSWDDGLIVQKTPLDSEPLSLVPAMALVESSEDELGIPRL